MNNVAMIIGKRLGLGVLTMFMVSIIIFLAVNMLPGDFAQALLGQSATPEAVAARSAAGILPADVPAIWAGIVIAFLFLLRGGE